MHTISWLIWTSPACTCLVSFDWKGAWNKYTLPAVSLSLSLAGGIELFLSETAHSYTLHTGFHATKLHSGESPLSMLRRWRGQARIWSPSSARGLSHCLQALHHPGHFIPMSTGDVCSLCVFLMRMAMMGRRHHLIPPTSHNFSDTWRL